MKRLLHPLLLLLFLSTPSIEAASCLPDDKSIAFQIENQSLEIEQLLEENEALQQENKQLKAQYNLLLQQLDNLSLHRGAPAKTANIKDHPYEQGKTLYQNKQYLQAINTLKYAAFGGDRNADTQNAMYLLSLSHRQLRHCEAAIDISKRFAEFFPTHKDAPNALYNMALCQSFLQQQDIAKNTLKQLIRLYPNSIAAKRAQSQTK